MVEFLFSSLSDVFTKTASIQIFVGLNLKMGAGDHNVEALPRFIADDLRRIGNRA